MVYKYLLMSKLIKHKKIKNTLTKDYINGYRAARASKVQSTKEYSGITQNSIKERGGKYNKIALNIIKDIKLFRRILHLTKHILTNASNY